MISNILKLCKILGFHDSAIFIFTLLEYCTVLIDSLLLAFQDNTSVLFSTVRQSMRNTRSGGCMNMYRGHLVHDWPTRIHYDGPVGFLGPWKELLLKSVVLNWWRHY